MRLKIQLNILSSLQESLQIQKEKPACECQLLCEEVRLQVTQPPRGSRGVFQVNFKLAFPIKTIQVESL